MAENKSADPDGMLSASQAGKLLGVSGKTIIRMMRDGDFPGYEISNSWKFKRREIEAYLESRKFQGKRSTESIDKVA